MGRLAFRPPAVRGLPAARALPERPTLTFGRARGRMELIYCAGRTGCAHRALPVRPALTFRDICRAGIAASKSGKKAVFGFVPFSTAPAVRINPIVTATYKGLRGRTFF